MPTRVALVEDNPTLRRRFIERFRFFDDLELVFAAGSGEECLEQLAALQGDRAPEVVLMDIELPGISGIDTTALLKEHNPDLDVIMLTVFEHEDRIFQSIQAGAAGYLLKDVSTDKIVGAVLEVRRGGAPMSPPVARKMLRYVRDTEPQRTRRRPDEPPPFSLSDREMEILYHLVEDTTEPTIADALCISPHTVRTHIKNIYKKLHVHSRASAVRVALERRLLG